MANLKSVFFAFVVALTLSLFTGAYAFGQTSPSPTEAQSTDMSQDTTTGNNDGTTVPSGAPATGLGGSR